MQHVPTSSETSILLAEVIYLTEGLPACFPQVASSDVSLVDLAEKEAFSMISG